MHRLCKVVVIVLYLILSISAGAYGNTFKNILGMTFTYISPGSFMMGSPMSELGHGNKEVRHKVTLTKGYYLQTTEVTQAQWSSVMGKNPSHYHQCGGNCPVDSVSWNDVQLFLAALSQKDPDHFYRLPTEAEWEYAARAGSDTAFANGKIKKLQFEIDPNLDKIGWYGGNSNINPHPVGQKKANDWGLYDMHGNVWEWCHDWYGDYPAGAVSDPTGSKTGSEKVMRGGSWMNAAGFCRSAERGKQPPDNRAKVFGFRIVMVSKH